MTRMSDFCCCSGVEHCSFPASSPPALPWEFLVRAKYQQKKGGGGSRMALRHNGFIRTSCKTGALPGSDCRQSFQVFGCCGTMRKFKAGHRNIDQEVPTTENRHRKWHLWDRCVWTRTSRLGCLVVTAMISQAARLVDKPDVCASWPGQFFYLQRKACNV